MDKLGFNFDYQTFLDTIAFWFLIVVQIAATLMWFFKEKMKPEIEKQGLEDSFYE